jgi:acetyl esterase/lipase
MMMAGVRRVGMAAFLTLGAWCGVVAQTTNAPMTNPAAIVAAAPKLLPASEIESPPDIVYATVNGYPLHAQLSYPKNPTGLLPAIMQIHGGGWIGGSYKFDTAGMARHGYFAISIEYRLDNVAKWPAQIEDCKLGVRWLRANAAKYNVDPNRIGAWGSSAGGHLVACLGTMADEKEYEGNGGYPGVSSAVQAVVDFYGPTDFTNLSPTVYSPVAVSLTKGLFGVAYAQNPALWKSGSPVAYVKAGDPPMLLVHGDSDGLVPVAQSLVFDAALTKAGVPHQLVIVKNGDHGFKPRPGTTIDPSNAQINAITMTFLAKYLQP